MESRFHADFGDVRVHTDAAAERSAGALGARAFTVGRDVAFSRAQYAPDTQSGRELIAHELAHVVQQSRGGPAPALDPAAPAEHAASAAASTTVHGSGPVSVQGATGVGVARDEDDSWYSLSNLERKGRAAISTVADAPGALKDKAAATYEAGTTAIRGKIDDLQEGYEEVKQAAGDQIAALNTPENRKKADAVAEKLANPSTIVAGATGRLRAAVNDLAKDAEESGDNVGRARAVQNMVGAVDDGVQAWSKLESEPKKKFAEALQKDGIVAGVKAWQTSMDDGLKGLTEEFKQGVNDWEDGKFDAPPQALFDPAQHPTLAGIEQSVIEADQTARKYQRQASGGVYKALWSMGTGIANIGVHPVQTVEGLGELPSLPGLGGAKFVGQTTKLLDDLITSDKSASQVFEEHGERSRFDPAKDLDRTGNLLKGFGENYIEAAGYKIDPNTKEVVKGGEARWGEIPGLLLVDIGSFFIPGGAATKGTKVASATGKTTEVLKALDVTSDIGKGLDVAGDLSKGLDAASDLGKGLDAAGDLGKTADVAGDVGKASNASKPTWLEDLSSKFGDLLEHKAPANDVRPPGGGGSGAPKLEGAAPHATPGSTGQGKVAEVVDLPVGQGKPDPRLKNVQPGERPPTKLADRQPPAEKPPTEPHAQPVPAEVAKAEPVAVGQTHGSGKGAQAPLSLVADNSTVASKGGGVPRRTPAAAGTGPRSSGPVGRSGSAGSRPGRPTAARARQPTPKHSDTPSFADVSRDLKLEKPGTKRPRPQDNRYPPFEPVRPSLQADAARQAQTLSQQLGINIPGDRVLGAPWTGRVRNARGKLQSSGTSQGWLRSESQFWSEFKRQFPDDAKLLGKDNTVTKALAEKYGWPTKGKNSVVGQKLVHHHMENGQFVAPIPEKLHRKLSGTIHAKPTVVGGRRSRPAPRRHTGRGSGKKRSRGKKRR
jgi:hypothetical protein